MLKIDIGGGTTPRPGFVNIDPIHGVTPFQFRIQDWLADCHYDIVGLNSVDEAYSSHCFEHIPAGMERIRAFNNVWDMLKPWAAFTIIVPIVINRSGRVFPQAFADPTHVSYWCAESFDYFCKPIAAADYGIRYWEKLSYRELGYEAECVLRKRADHV